MEDDDWLVNFYCDTWMKLVNSDMKRTGTRTKAEVYLSTRVECNTELRIMKILSATLKELHIKKILSVALKEHVKPKHRYIIISGDSRYLFGIDNVWDTDRKGRTDEEILEDLNTGLFLLVYDIDAIPLERDFILRELLKVLDSHRNGWTKSDPSEHDGIFLREDPDEFYLFLKEKTFVEEDTLIRLILMLWNLNNISGIDYETSCNCVWKDSYGGVKHTNTMYLWVKKTSLEKVRSILKFDI